MVFSSLKSLTIPEGEVAKITAGGVVLWEKPATFTNLANPKDSYWGEGYRISSAGANVAETGATATNYTACVKDDVIRIKGLTLGGYNCAVYYGLGAAADSHKPKFPESSYGWNCEEERTGVYKFTIVYKQTTHIRFSGVLVGKSEDVIITRNEEII